MIEMGFVLSAVPEDPSLYNTENGYAGDSGFDLVCPETITVPGKAISFMIDLKIKVAMTEVKSIPYRDVYSTNEYYPRSCALYPRSSMGSKTPLRLCNSVGVIDSGYRGNIKIVVDNVSDKEFVIEKGTRLVQICLGDLRDFRVEIVSQLNKTERGEKGFGSTN